MKKIKYPFLFLLAATFFACAVSESFKIGEELSMNKRWDEAIVYYEKAISENPDSADCQNALNRVKRESAKVHFAKARKALSETTSPNFPRLEPILKEMEKAAALDPEDREIAEALDKVKAKKSELQATVKMLYDRADGDMKKEDWPAAIDKLKKINQLYPGYEDTGDKLESSIQQALKTFYKEGIEFGKKEEWKLAVRSFKSLADLNPQYLDSATQLKQAIGRDNAGYHAAEGDKAAASHNWVRAIFMYEKVALYQPEDRAIVKKISELKNKAADDLFNGAAKAFRHAKLAEAVRKLQLARFYSPAIQDNPLHREFSGNLCAKLMERSEKYAELGKWGNALIWFQMAEFIDPNYKNIFHRIQETKDNIKKRIRKSIAVFDFKGPAGSRDAGKIVANKLITYLYKYASGDLRIIERENLESILKELQLGQTGLVDVDTVQKVGKMGGIDTFIMGDVLRFSTEYKDYPSVSQVKVLVDEEEVHNPAFSDWLYLHKNPSEEEMKAAPSRTIKKKNYQLLSYRSGYAKITAGLEASYKLVDTRTGENLFANTVSGRLTKEDKYQDGVPLAGLVQNVLELPTEMDVLDELTATKITEIGQSVLKHFQNLEVVYFNQAQQQLKRRNMEDAVEKFTDAVFDEQLKGITTPISKKSKAMIEDLTKGM